MRAIVWLAAGALAPGLIGCAAPRGETADQRKAWADRMADETLSELRQNEQTAARLDEQSVALGVFEVININALIFSTTGGYGVIIDRESGERTYVEVLGGGPGLGAGFTRARSVYVLRTRDIAEAFQRGVVSWNGEGELAWRPAGRGFSMDGVGTLQRSTEAYHDIRHGISVGASVKAVGVFP
jgi:lipid-binding SYLF domain-containing protein